MGFSPRLHGVFRTSVHPDVECQGGALDGQQLLVVEGSAVTGTPGVYSQAFCPPNLMHACSVIDIDIAVTSRPNHHHHPSSLPPSHTHHSTPLNSTPSPPPPLPTRCSSMCHFLCFHWFCCATIVQNRKTFCLAKIEKNLYEFFFWLKSKKAR